MKNWKILLFSFALFSKKSFPIPKIFDEITAIVNTDVILKSDIDKLIATVKYKTGFQNLNSFEINLPRYRILERLIMDQIILQTGEKIEEQIFDKQIDHIIYNMAEMNGMSLDQIKKN